MNLIRNFAGQAVIYGIGSILSRVIYYLVVVVLLTHILGKQTDEFGTYGYFYAYAAVLITLFSFRLDTALFRYGNKTEDLESAFSTTFTAVVFSSVLLAFTGVFADQFVADLIGFSDYPHYVRWFSFILAFDVINLIPFAKLRLQNKATRFAGYKIFNVVLSMLLILFFLVVLPKYPELFSFLPHKEKIIEWVFISNLIASATLFLVLLSEVKGYSFKIDGDLLKKMMVYVFPLVIVGVASGVIQFFANPLQKMYLPGTAQENLSQAGIYDLTRRIAGLFVMFTTAFNYAAEPFFFNNSSEGDRKLLYGKICRLFTLVGGLVIVGMYFSVDLLKYISTSDYWSSIPLLPILLLAYLFLGIYYNVSIWYKLSDNTKYGAYISILGMVITLVISVVFLPNIGYAASAWATLCSYVAMVVVGYLIGQRLFPIHYPVAKILQDLLLITALLMAGHLARTHASVSGKYISYCLMFLFYVWYMYTAERVEWKKLFKLNY